MSYIPPATKAIRQNKMKKASTNENVEKLEPSYTDGENVKWCSCHRKQLGDSHVPNIVITMYSVISYLCIYLRQLEVSIQANILHETKMFNHVW